MSDMPRFALGTTQPQADLCPFTWALLDTFDELGWKGQSFRSTASLAPVHGARCITGHSQRHLDSWLMSKATAREIFAHGSIGADIALVEGCFDSGRASGHKSSLDTLSEWLELPQIAVVDVQRLASCQRLELPQHTAGLLLDRVHDIADGLRWRTELETLHGIPVLGFLDDAFQLRSLLNARQSGLPCRELCAALGRRLRRTLNVERLLQIVQVPPLATAARRLFSPPETDDSLSIAIAFDEAFQAYFADTLDLLEERGARIVDFSPLRSETLPWDTDIVYLAGHSLEHCAEELSRNYCLMQALRNFVAQGGRIYAEASGLAYLCESVVLADGRQFPMAGLLPGIAVARRPQREALPAELTFGRNSWLGDRGVALRGYFGGEWEILPGPDMISFAPQDASRWQLVGTDRVVACGMQVDFAGQPHLVSNFFRPRLGAFVNAY